MNGPFVRIRPKPIIVTEAYVLNNTRQENLYWNVTLTGQQVILLDIH